MTNATIDRALVSDLAGEFDFELRRVINADDYDVVLATNRTPAFASGCCATHDFCDANEVMAAAFRNTIGRKVKANSEEDSALWNAAWELWRERTK